MTPRKIVTSYVNPPIPTRHFDWCAFEEGCEEDGNYGWGKTEEEAINDLVCMREWEEETDEPLP